MAGGREYTIGLVIDKGQATAATNRVVADLKEVERQAKQTGATIEHEARQGGDAQVQASGRARDAHGRLIKEGREGAESHRQAMEGSVGATESLGGAFQKVMIQAAAFQGVVQFGRAIISTMEDATKRAEDLARAVIKQRDAVRDIATIKGEKGGVSDTFLREHADFRVATGMTGDKAHAFVESFAGSGELSRGKTIDEAQYRAYETGLARLTMARGLSADEMGDLGGGLLRFKDYRGDAVYDADRQHISGGGAAEALADVAIASDVLARGKGKNKVLDAQLAKVNSTFLNQDKAKGMFVSGGDTAAMVSVAAEFDPERSGELIMQAGRALRGFDKEQAPALAAAGIGWKDPMVALGEGGLTGEGMVGALPKLFAVLDKEVGKGKTSEQALTEMDFKSMEERRAISVLYNNRSLLEDQLEYARANRSAAGVKAEVDRAYAGDTGLRMGVGDARIERAQLFQGFEGEQSEVAKREAEARLVERRAIGTAAAGWGEWIVGGVANPLSRDWSGTGRKIRVENEAIGALRDAGGDVEGPQRGDLINTLSFGYADVLRRGAWTASGQGNSALEAGINTRRMTAAVESETGAVGLGGGQETKELVRLMAEQNRMVADQNRPRPIPKQVPPNAQMAR